jgi:hypothetical protein
MPNWTECRIPECEISESSIEQKAELEGMLIPEGRNLECRTGLKTWWRCKGGGGYIIWDWLGKEHTWLIPMYRWRCTGEGAYITWDRSG